MENAKVIHIGDIPYYLEISSFEEGINIDECLKIHYDKIYSDIITFSIILNRFGILLTEIENYLSEEELNLSLLKDNFGEFKGKISKEIYDSLVREGIKSPTLAQIDGQLVQREDYKIEKDKITTQERKILTIRKDKGIINSIYWSAKGKQNLLEKLSDKLTPLDFEEEMICKTINGITIKKIEKGS